MDWGLLTLISTLIKDAEVFSCVKLYGQDFDYLITIQFKWHNFQFTIKKLEDLENVPCLGNYLNMEHNNYVGFKICQTNTPIEKSRYILLNIDHRLNSTINLSLIIVEGNRTMKANIPLMENSFLQTRMLLDCHPNNDILPAHEYDICWKGYINY